MTDLNISLSIPDGIVSLILVGIPILAFVWVLSVIADNVAKIQSKD